MNEPLVPPALVLGCNTPHGIGVLSDWIEERTGHAPDFAGAGWSHGVVTDDMFYCGNGNGDGECGGEGDGDGYGSSSGDGNGLGHRTNVCIGYCNTYGYANGNGRGDGYRLGDGNGIGCGDGNGRGLG